ncbi:TetR/AcrR family transcriptional regulator [Mesorhizobium sp. M7A.F.Ca.CA.001.07.2.1]|uniref:TetR/AcrR family transcriptional regulator n=2 Tax=Phyllobacteriaceae TaxID=69277 RepID=UPI000FCCA3DD|nr:MULTISPECIES: TetR/AcrR family transcriptional regulator [Mesorhizobium]RVB44826.1 TetR/AcrR family transcriptional regulator [Mesorhizobium sp. M7A.F.Ca.CA.004.05.1.1]MCF6126775.1 TetR/AcrR family transcriptional regulator [Mesorhizobium ciceri]MCQ8816410.1 TetR/AcrR family transcriptional regulator [Mesorhizobium sp. SEMIA396]RUX79113.1 TetR/AcrR family transcriptional regulator [Mesorhizobium sp. M7A.F.Ca.CA.004.08.2.1]RUX85854.1 TetR/AcrR family transcriptional regulator [Mesorhizobium 
MKSMASTSEKILDVAQSLIVAGGYNGFSYADISADIGIRKASIHHHFPTKAELVSVLVDRYRRQAEVGLESLRGELSSPAEQLQSYLNYWRTCIRDASPSFCVCAMLAGEMQMLPEEVASRVRAHFQNLAGWLTSVLRAGMEQDLFRLNNRPEEEAQMLMASVHGAMLSARAFSDPGLFTIIVTPQITRLLGRDC